MTSFVIPALHIILMYQPFKKVSFVSMFVDPLLWPYRRPSRLYAVRSVVDMAVQFTYLIVYGMLQPFVALVIFVNIIVTGCFRLLLVSRFVHFAENQTDQLDSETKIRAVQEDSAAGANSIPGSLTASQSLVVANPINDAALSRDRALDGAVSVTENDEPRSEEKEKENEDNNDLSKLTKEEVIAIALSIFKDPTLCVVASLLSVLISATLFLTLVFSDMALDRAPKEE